MRYTKIFRGTEIKIPDSYINDKISHIMSNKESNKLYSFIAYLHENRPTLCKQIVSQVACWPCAIDNFENVVVGIWQNTPPNKYIEQNQIFFGKRILDILHIRNKSGIDKELVSYSLCRFIFGFNIKVWDDNGFKIALHK